MNWTMLLTSRFIVYIVKIKAPTAVQSTELFAKILSRKSLFSVSNVAGYKFKQWNFSVRLSFSLSRTFFLYTLCPLYHALRPRTLQVFFYFLTTAVCPETVIVGYLNESRHKKSQKSWFTLIRLTGYDTKAPHLQLNSLLLTTRR